MELIDLRSDTVTKPSTEMREAMCTAMVGDDVYGEDSTVNQLREKVANLLGKEAALFVPSGVMANQIAIKTHTQPGDEVIVERESHIFNYETAGAAFLSNVQLNTIKGTHGILSAEQIVQEIRSPVYYNPRATLVCLENTHNKAGGIIYPLQEIAKIYTLAKKCNFILHLDGARLWNASVATGITPMEYAKFFDTISVCFSKGLGAPIGSALVGSKEKIDLARKYRKIFGGGMRQVGIIAAAALYALDHNIDRLKEDHEKAKLFATAIASIHSLDVNLELVQTNIVIIKIKNRIGDVDQLIRKFRENGVLLSEMDHTTLRAVTHLNVTFEQVKRAAEVVKLVM